MVRFAALVGLVVVVGVIAWTLATDPSASPAVASSGEPGGGSRMSPPPILADEVDPLRDLDGWLQTDIRSLAELRGEVVIVQFWTFSCVNCKRTLPHLQALYSEHGHNGLEIVGIHSPEFTFEEDPAAVAEAARELGVTWAIALDTRQRNFFGWQGSRGYWPRTYVLDGEGRVRFDHIGEGAYEELAATVDYLLKESA